MRSGAVRSLPLLAFVCLGCWTLVHAGIPCAVVNEACKKDEDCCASGVECIKGVCDVTMCSPVFDVCKKSEDCCGGLQCRKGRCMEECVGAGLHCKRSKDCCGNGKCKKGKCTKDLSMCVNKFKKCGGKRIDGELPCCDKGYVCKTKNPFFSQCRPIKEDPCRELRFLTGMRDICGKRGCLKRRERCRRNRQCCSRRCRGRRCR